MTYGIPQFAPSLGVLSRSDCIVQLPAATIENHTSPRLARSLHHDAGRRRTSALVHLAQHDGRHPRLRANGCRGMGAGCRSISGPALHQAGSLSLLLRRRTRHAKRPELGRSTVSGKLSRSALFLGTPCDLKRDAACAAAITSYPQGCSRFLWVTGQRLKPSIRMMISSRMAEMHFQKITGLRSISGALVWLRNAWFG